jgi:O-acetylhomoserine/O-acetylserine sulfhydrylase-like pyridoxal-dependent enzyme
MRYKNVEFRRAGVADSNGYTVSSDRSAEIVGWMDNNGKESCYTLCWIKEDKEGFYIETIGNRFTEYEDIEALMHVAKYTLRILDTEKEFKERML